jgi:ABC-2 type transport system ATP-binding protein
MAEPVIKIENFSKSFDDHQVVKDLSFEVHQGETFAFLGANGSGKTTTIRCLLGIMKPTAGELLIDGQAYNINLADHIGYLPEERGLYVDSNVLETMVYFGELKGLTKAAAEKKSIAYLERVGLADKQKAKIKTLSSGQQQKIQLGLTIINDPKLLVLDEPTKGLDPVNRELLLDILEEMKSKGTTIIFITHQMEEVEKIADRLVMIKNGQRELYGGVMEVRRQFGQNRIHLDYTGLLARHDDLYAVELEENNTAELAMKDGVTPGQVFKALAKNDMSITRFELALPSLQDIFVKVQQR